MRSLGFPLLVLLIYAWLFPWLPSLRSPNELSRLYQARAIVEDHTLSVNGQLARHGPVGDLSVKDGRYYPNKAPGVSFLGAAAFAVVRAARGAGLLPRVVPGKAQEARAAGAVGEAEAVFWLRLLVCVLPGALAAEFLRRILARRFEPALAASGAIVFALGTIMWPYSTLLMSHGPAAAALVACWWAVENAREGRGRRWWALAGFAAGWAVLIEYTSALALPPLLLLSLSAREAGARSLPTGSLAGGGLRPGPAFSPAGAAGRSEGRQAAALAMALGFLPPVLGLALYHQAAYGNPFDTGYRHLVSPVFAQWHARGFLGVGAPSLRALAGSFLDPARGLFAWSPFLALGVPGLLPLWRRDRALALACAAELGLYALFTASFTYQAWGWSVGPRHITPACAFLLPPALAAAEWLRDRGWGFAAAGLALSGMAGLALTVAVCPYLPDELTNPIWQLVLPLARMGLRAPDALGMALHTGSGFTFLPWLALLLTAAGWTTVTLSRRRGERGRPGGSSAPALLAALLAVALLALQSRLGGPDRFEATRQFMAARYAAGGR